MAPAPLSTLIPRTLKALRSAAPTLSLSSDNASPIAVQDLHKRATSDTKVSSNYGGGTPADAFNNLGIQILFALIGAGMVIASIWFFFWAKNGGFKRITKDDWEDYKSTVLRRKGPDGRTLSNATKSTKLGGGSVVHGQAYTEYTDESYKEEKPDRDRDLESGILTADWSREERRQRRKDQDLRQYRHEKPARVGGLNRQADGTTNTDPSEVSVAPKSKPSADKNAKKEEHRREKERKAREKQEAKNAAMAAKKEKERAKAADKERKEREKEKGHERSKSKAPPSSSKHPAPPLSTITGSEISTATYDTHETSASTAQLLAKDKNGQARRSAPSAAYSFVVGEDDAKTTFSGTNTHTTYSDVYSNSQPSHVTHDSYYSQYRPNATINPVQPEIQRHAARRDRDRDAHRSSQPALRERDVMAAHRASPAQQERERHRSSPSSAHRPSREQSRSPRKRDREQQRSSRLQSEVASTYMTNNSDETGTKVYPCYIPGVSKSGPSEMSSEGSGIDRDRMDRIRGSAAQAHPPAPSTIGPYDSASQIGGRGYRRGQQGRRESLDSVD